MLGILTVMLREPLIPEWFNLLMEHGKPFAVGPYPANPQDPAMESGLRSQFFMTLGSSSEYDNRTMPAFHYALKGNLQVETNYQRSAQAAKENVLLTLVAVGNGSGGHLVNFKNPHRKLQTSDDLERKELLAEIRAVRSNPRLMGDRTLMGPILQSAAALIRPETPITSLEAIRFLDKEHLAVASDARDIDSGLFSRVLVSLIKVLKQVHYSSTPGFTSTHKRELSELIFGMCSAYLPATSQDETRIFGTCMKEMRLLEKFFAE
jgi:hypothetical protein